MIETNHSIQQESLIQQSCNFLRQGGVLVYPTETSWGLGVDAFNEQAVRNLFQAKGREGTKAMSVLVSHVSMAMELAHITPQVRRALEVFWPGPITFVLPIKDLRLKLVSGGSDYVGLRCSSHSYVQELVGEYQGPITTTSANPSGQPSAMTKDELHWVPEEFQVVEGVEAFGKPASLVVQLLEDSEGSSGKSRYKVLRPSQENQAKYLQMLNEMGFREVL